MPQSGRKVMGFKPEERKTAVGNCYRALRNRRALIL